MKHYMKILSVQSHEIADIKLISYQKFADNRGYFSETFRKSDIAGHGELNIVPDQTHFLQANESYSKKNVIRGLHFQWNPFMGKMVRVIKGHMIDLFLDIRIGSPTYGKIGGFELKADYASPSGQWVWVPVGFAHGVVFFEESIIEYLCTGEYSPGCEAGISPFSQDINWSAAGEGIEIKVKEILTTNAIVSDKDKQGHSLTSWSTTPESKQFVYSG